MSINNVQTKCFHIDIYVNAKTFFPMGKGRQERRMHKMRVAISNVI